MLEQFRTQELVWDKANRSIFEPIQASADDQHGRRLKVQIVNGGVIEDLSGAQLYLAWQTPTKSHSGLEPFSIIDAAQGTFELYYPTGMLSHSGKLRSGLVITDSNGRLVSREFVINVDKNLIDDDAAESSDEFTALTQALIDIRSLEDDYAPQLQSVTAQLAQTTARVDTIIELPDGSTTNDARLEDIKVLSDGDVRDSPGEAVRAINKRALAALDESNYPFDSRLNKMEVKEFITDISLNSYEDYDQYSLRFADDTEDKFNLILYGWSGNAKTIVARINNVPKTSNSTIAEMNFTLSKGAVLLDYSFIDKISNVMTKLVANTDGFFISNKVKSMITRDFTTRELEQTQERYKMDADFFIKGATLGASSKSRANKGIFKCKIYLKKNIANVSLHRLYESPGANIRNVEIKYLDSSGNEKGIIHTVPVIEQKNETITLENDDIYVYMEVDWGVIGIVRNSGGYSYEETGINRNRIIPYHEYLFLKERKGGSSEVISDNIDTNLIICGHDATPYQLSVGNAMKDLGYGYVCQSDELDEGVNSFIDSFINQNVTIKFFGTIRTSHGIHKHPKHNLIGHDCKLKMGDNLGQDYYSCIYPTSGGVRYEQSVSVSHNHTFVRGFTLDGNANNNKVGEGYVYKDIYGGVIGHEIYNEDVPPYSRTQLTTDIVLEDIKAVNTMRGIITGSGWISRNLSIGNAETDHAIYIAGANNSIVENVYMTGYHKRGAVAISSMSWDSNLRVRNSRLRNFTLDECWATHGPLLSIRGIHSPNGNRQALDDLFIDGFFIKRTEVAPTGAIVVQIGTNSASELNEDYSEMDYPTNIQIRNFVADIALTNSLFVASNVNLIMKYAHIRLRDYRPDRPLFRLQNNSKIKRPIDFEGLRVSYVGEPKVDPFTIFGIDNSSIDHSVINGMNLDNLTIGDNFDYYLFGRITTENSNSVDLKNISADKLLVTPVANINPESSSYINFTSDDYHVL